MADSSAIARLDAIGLTSGASEEQRQGLSSLSEEEVSTLLSIKQRLEAAGPDVQGHADEVGWTFW